MSRTPLPLLTLGVLALACSGTETSQSVPPTPPPTAPPASLAVHAGAHQEGAPGTTVAVKPAVLVRDAQQRGVKGVRVSFAVDSGAGGLSGSEAVTGSDGVATVGDWRLGPAEGRNRLRAEVAGLAPVYFTATGRLLAATSVDTTLGASGGTVVIRNPRDPLDGLMLTVPAGAYAAPVHWEIGYSASDALPQRPELQPLTPLIRISNGQEAYADSILLLRIPVRVPADQFASAFFYDASDGTIEAIPLVARDSVSLTVATRHFSAAALLRRSPTGAAPAPSQSGAFGQVQIFVTGINWALLNQDFDSGFRVGVDDWEFPNHGSYLSPLGICEGMTLSAIWYYYRLKAQFGNLFGRYDSLPNLWYDNPQGIRMASDVQLDVDWAGMTTLLRAQVGASRSSGIGYDSLMYYSLAHAFHVTGMPQQIGIMNTGLTFGHALVATAIRSQQLQIADPNLPGGQGTIDFRGGRFQPYVTANKYNGVGLQFPVTEFHGITALIPFSTLDFRFNQLRADQAGDARFPSYQLMKADSANGLEAPFSSRQPVFTPDIWLSRDCPACRIRSSQGVGIAPFPGRPPTQATRVPLVPGVNRLGILLMDHDDFIDFRWATIVRGAFSVVPDTLTGAFDASDSLLARSSVTPPRQARYVWDFGDQSPPVTMLKDSTVTHVYTGRYGSDSARSSPDIPHSYTVTVRLHDDSAGGRLLATATGRVVREEGMRWRLTQFNFVGETGQPFSLPTHPLNFINAEIPDFLDPIVATPRNAFLVWLPPGSKRYLAAHPNYASPAWGWFTPPTTGASVHLHWEPVGLAMRAATLHRPLAVADPAVFLNPHWAQAARPLDIQDSLGLTGTLQAGRLKGRGLYFAQQAFHQDRWSPAQLLYLVDASFQADTVSGTVQLRRRLIVMNGHNPHRDTLAVFGDRTRTYQFRGIRERP